MAKIDPKDKKKEKDKKSKNEKPVESPLLSGDDLPIAPPTSKYFRTNSDKDDREQGR